MLIKKNARNKQFKNYSWLNTKFSEAENEVPRISNYITTQEFNKLTRDLYQIIYGTKMILIIN